MNRRCFYPLPVLIAVVMLVSGCGTTELPDLVDFKGNKPWIFLAGAKVQEAKSLAMGSAVTKGWQIADTAGDKLLVKRPLSAATAEAIAGEPVAMAAIEVKTDFNQRRAGVDVIVAAAMVTHKLTEEGEKSAVRVDVTENYKETLNRSLNALRQSWERNRWRIAAAMRPALTKGKVSEDEDRGDTFGTGADGKTDTPAPPPPKKAAAAPVADSSTGDRAVTATVPSTRGRPAPVEDRALSMPYPVAPSTTDSTLTTAAPIGVWGSNDRATITVPPVGVPSRAAPIEDRALSRPRPMTPSTTPGTLSGRLGRHTRLGSCPAADPEEGGRLGLITPSGMQGPAGVNARGWRDYPRI